MKLRSDETAARAAYLFTCALLTVHFLFLPYGGYERMMEGKYICFLALTGAFAAAMCAVLPLARARLDAMRLCAALYFGFSALSALLSPYGARTLLGGSRREGLVTLALYAAIYFLLSAALRPDGRLICLTAVSVTLCSLLVLAQTAGLNPLGLYPAGLGYFDGDVAYAGFFAGTSGNADFTAFLLALSLCVLLAAMLRLRRWALAVPAAAAAAALLRLGVAGPAVGAAFAALWSPALIFPEKRKKLLALSAALSLLALAAVYLYSGDGETLSQAARLLHGELDGSFGSGRVAIWRNCLPLVAERPLLGGGPDTLWLRGVEPLTWMKDGRAVPADVTAAHNEYLNILINQGAAALAAYLALIVLALVRCFRLAREPRFALCGAGLLCYAVSAMFSISTCITAPYVWLLLAAAGGGFGQFDEAPSLPEPENVQKRK